MSTDLGASFNEQYMNINTKLKKGPEIPKIVAKYRRFMRKPNISEATNEFIALAIQCEHSEQPAFAGHAYVGAAKCEATAGNFLGEAEQYLAAARQFMKAEKKLKALKFYSPDRENLEAAIGCFMQALTKYPEKSSIRTSILMELADNLVSLNLKLEAVSYYEQALESIEDKTRRLMFMRNLLNLLIDCGRFDAALENANKLCDSNFNMPEDILIEIQTTRVLLTLLLEPDEEGKPISLKQLFTNLMSDCGSDGTPFSTDLQLKLQSIAIACTTADVNSLVSVAADLRQFLTTPQTDLLDTLVKHKRAQHLSLA